MQEVITYFESMQDQFLDVSTKINKVGILDVDEFFKANVSGRRHLIEALKSVDEVWMIDKSTQSSLDYMKLRRQLEAEDIVCGNKLFTLSDPGMSTMDMVTQLAHDVNGREAAYLRSYFFVTNDKNVEKHSTELTANHVHPLIVKSDRIAKDYKKQIHSILKEEHILLRERYISVVKSGLEREINRLNVKYKNAHWDVRHRFSVDERIKQIKDTLRNLDFAYNEKTLTHASLVDALQSLETLLIELQVQQRMIIKSVPNVKQIIQELVKKPERVSSATKWF